MTSDFGAKLKAHIEAQAEDMRKLALESMSYGR